MNQSVNNPISQSEREESLDVLRGFALLGILIVNIQTFSMIGSAYFFPYTYGDMNGINYWVWWITHTFADQKFMTIFTMLFGAGIVVFTTRAESKNRKVFGLYYRRTLLLLIFGLIHAYCLWHGDILVAYALCALFIYFFRKFSPKFLIPFGIIFLIIGTSISLLSGLSAPNWPEESRNEFISIWDPSEEEIQYEMNTMQGNWMEQMDYRVPSSMEFQTFIFLFWSVWRVSGLMLIGMALYKLGILSGKYSNRFYSIFAILCLTIGLSLAIYGIQSKHNSYWEIFSTFFITSEYNYWGSIFVSLGYISAIVLICNNQLLGSLRIALAIVGKTAFSNYILQTLICTTLFYGHGFGWFGQVERWGQLIIVVLIWIFQLILSTLWLRYFRCGPLEWVWRSLTYMKMQPFRT